jgi:CRISPR-associated protein Cas1
LIEVEMGSVLSPSKRESEINSGDLFSGIIRVVLPTGPRQARRVTPVDYKVGAPRHSEDGNQLWDADKMQLGLQILILRDNGYACDEGVIYYQATRQRVKLTMTAELEVWIEATIAEAREAARGTLPPPLVDSPKCVRCSLAPICLPDETQLLVRMRRDRQEAADSVEKPVDDVGEKRAIRPRAFKAPRRLMTARDDRRALYLNSQGARVTQRSEVLVVKDEGSVLGEFRMQDVSHVALFGNIQMTTQAIRQLCDAEIPIAYFSMGGWFYGLTRGHGMKNVFTRIEQFQWARDPRACLALAQRMVHGKIRNQRTQIMRNHVSLPDGS